MFDTTTIKVVLLSLTQARPEEYGTSPSEGETTPRECRGISEGGANAPMEIEDSVDASVLGTMSEPLEVLDDSDDGAQEELPVEDEEGKRLEQIERSIAVSKDDRFSHRI